MDPNAEKNRAEFNPPMERLLTVEEVARLLQVSPGWVYDHADRKRPLIQSVRLGKAVRFRGQDVQKFIEAMMRRSG
jgi:excisionase family DNA binding protein